MEGWDFTQVKQHDITEAAINTCFIKDVVKWNKNMFSWSINIMYNYNKQMILEGKQQAYPSS